jgi:DNA-directed RNA polymerase beta subunit
LLSIHIGFQNVTSSESIIASSSSQVFGPSLISNNCGDEKSQSKDNEVKVPSEKICVKNGVLENVFIGKIPAMVMSNICYLADMQKEERKRLGQCHIDGGGYFIINGSEKVQLLSIFRYPD